MSDKITELIATFFYTGKFPVAPGTVASAAATLLAIGLHQNIVLQLLAIVGVILIGIPVSARMEKIVGKKDPGCVVIDEVAGVLISFFMLPLTESVIFVTFFLFRAFDMFKLYPANVIEARGGGTGIVMDDVVAGIYTNIAMQIAVRLAGIV